MSNIRSNSVEEIRKARQLIEQFGLKAKILCAPTREVLNVVEWLAAGSHIVTVLPKFLEDMIVHPYSKETVQHCLGDAQKAEESLVVEGVAAPVLAVEAVKPARSLEPVNQPAR